MIKKLFSFNGRISRQGYWIYFFVIVFGLIGCYDRAKYVNRENTVQLSKEEKLSIQSMFYGYAIVDKSLYQKTKENYISITGDTITTGIDDNIKKVNEISVKGLNLLKTDSLYELMLLLEKERPQFENNMIYSVDNALEYNNALFILYKCIYKDDEKTLNKKIMNATENVIEYIYAVHDFTTQWDERFFYLSIGMADLYMKNGDIDKAILYKERMREFVVEVDGIYNSKDFVSLTTELEKLYRDRGEISKANACKRQLIEVKEFKEKRRGAVIP